MSSQTPAIKSSLIGYIPFAEFFCLHRKYLLFNFLSRNLKLKYRRSWFGYFWTLLIPMAQVTTFYFVYRVVLKVQVDNYLAYIISGLLPWVFFASSLNEGMESLVSNHHLLIHASIPVQAFPASVTITNFINLVPSIPLIYIVYYLDSGTVPGASSLLILPLCLALLLFTYSLSFLLASLYVFLRDLKHLINITIQLWLYVTPVLYRSEMIPESYRWVLWANPLAGFFISVRQCLFENRVPDLIQVGAFLTWAVGTLIVAEAFRKKVGRFLPEKL